MAARTPHVFLGAGGPLAAIKAAIDCGPVPPAGWFHHLPEVLKGALCEGSAHIARAAMGIDVRTFAATQVFPVILHVLLTTSPAEASQDALVGEAAIDTVRAVDALLGALKEDRPRDGE